MLFCQAVAGMPGRFINIVRTEHAEKKSNHVFDDSAVPHFVNYIGGIFITINKSAMAVKVYWVHRFHNGARLGIMARPRGNDWLEEEIISLERGKAGLCVSLLEQAEIAELGLQQQESFCRKHGIGYLHFPIADRSVPQDDTKTKNVIREIEDKIKSGLSVVIHCRMGIGRSSIIAGCVLKRADIGAGEAIAMIGEARGLKVPDTEQQLAWLKNRD